METVSNLAPHIKVMPALVLDFDGTIRRSKTGQTFIKNFEDIELMPGIEPVIWHYRDSGYLILGISNQAGVAHGFKLPLEVEAEMERTFNLFSKNPFHIAKHCYHDDKGKIEPYNHRSLLRKPDIGMLAIMEHEAYQHGYVVDWDKSLFVGDRPEDEECAKRAGITFQHIHNFLKVEAQKNETLPDTLDEAVEVVYPMFEGMDNYFTEKIVAGPIDFGKGVTAFCNFCHSQLSGGIGMQIRNKFKLWERSPLALHFETVHGVKHPDDMSHLILSNVYQKYHKIKSE